MKLYEITVSFCLHAESQEEAFALANIETEDLQNSLRNRFDPKTMNPKEKKDMDFFYIDEPQEL